MTQPNKGRTMLIAPRGTCRSPRSRSRVVSDQGARGQPTGSAAGTVQGGRLADSRQAAAWLPFTAERVMRQTRLFRSGEGFQVGGLREHPRGSSSTRGSLGRLRSCVTRVQRSQGSQSTTQNWLSVGRRSSWGRVPQHVDALLPSANITGCGFSVSSTDGARFNGGAWVMT
jgi:hypothetical protein